MTNGFTKGTAVAGSSPDEGHDQSAGSTAHRSDLSGRQPLLATFIGNWKLIVLPVVAAVLIAWIVAGMQPRRYRASAIAGVVPIGQGLDPTAVIRSVEVLERRTVVATVAALASTPSTRRQAVPSQAGDYRMSAVVLPNTNLFRVDVEASNPAEAAAIANRIPALLGAQTRAMFGVYGVATMSPATEPTAPVSPRVSRAIAAGLLLGLLISAALTYTVHALRARPTIS